MVGTRNRNNQNKGQHSLWQEILTFKKYKILFLIILVILGGLGLIIPVIPGLLFLLLAVALFKPGLMQKIREKLKQWNI